MSVSVSVSVSVFVCDQVLMYGAGDPHGIIDKCNMVAGEPDGADYMFAACIDNTGYLRTLLQVRCNFLETVLRFSVKIVRFVAGLGFML